MPRRSREDFINDSEEEDVGGTSAEERAELVNKCVRFMLMRNSKQRKPVRRAELSKYVMQGREARGKTKEFNSAFEEAKEQLKLVFGLQVVEVYKRARASASQSQRRTQTQSSQGESLAKAYILVSALEGEERVAKNERDWPQYGLLTIIAGIIALTPECKVSQDDLYRHLARCGCPVKSSRGHLEINCGNVRDYLEKVLPEQWYLEREKDFDVGFAYKIGPRLWAELNPQNIVQFVEAVYGEFEDDSVGLDTNAKNELLTKLNAECNVALGQEVDDVDSD